MAQKLINKAAGLRAQVFHDGDKGMRGITFMRCAGPRGDCLYVTVLDEHGKRKARTSYSLKGASFLSKWELAVQNVAEYYGISQNDPIYEDMMASAGAFLDRYNLTLVPITTLEARVKA